MSEIDTRATKRILVIDDCPSLSELYADFLSSQGYHTDVARCASAALQILQASSEPFDIALLDMKLPDMDGVELLGIIKDKYPNIAILIITGHGSVSLAVQSMRMGAREFLVKPFPLDRLTVSIDKIINQDIVFVDQDDGLAYETVPHPQKMLQPQRFKGFIGSSAIMNDVYQIIECAAASDATAFITGESGTGKEVCAEAIHQSSKRAGNKFIALNCAAIPHDLIESELFGHIKGAFTGAIQDRKGSAALADGGTLFLDEVGEMPLAMQSKLLRFIQTLSFQPVGGSKPQTVDIRLICATNRNPMDEVNAGRFREDLFYRLHVIPIHMPPLRDRDQDIIDIARSFLTKFSSEEGKRFQKFSVAAERELLRYDWPGNIRQLQNIVRNIVVMHDGDAVDETMLPLAMMRTSEQDNNCQVNNFQQFKVASGLSQNSEVEPLWLHEKQYIENVIRQCNGQIPRAAGLLEISPSTIYRKISQWKKINSQKNNVTAKNT